MKYILQATSAAPSITGDLFIPLCLFFSLSRSQYTRNNSLLFEWFSIKFIHNVAANIYWLFRSKKISIKTRRDNINILPYPLRIIILLSHYLP